MIQVLKDFLEIKQKLLTYSRFYILLSGFKMFDSRYTQFSKKKHENLAVLIFCSFLKLKCFCSDRSNGTFMILNIVHIPPAWIYPVLLPHTLNSQSVLFISCSFPKFRGNSSSDLIPQVFSAQHVGIAVVNMLCERTLEFISPT